MRAPRGNPFVRRPWRVGAAALAAAAVTVARNGTATITVKSYDSVAFTGQDRIG